MAGVVGAGGLGDGQLLVQAGDFLIRDAQVYDLVFGVVVQIGYFVFDSVNGDGFFL